MNKVIVIAGPTGVGKTNISIELAKKLNADIISADSAQVYKYLDIGTAKITEEEKQGIKHYMLDVVEPIEKYSVGSYEKVVNSILLEKEKENKNIIIVGGTGLYIDAITDGLSILPVANKLIRDSFQTMSNEDLFNKLKELDEEAAKSIHINNRVRLERALEVCLLTDNKFSLLSRQNIKNNNCEFFKFALTRDRENLYERINQRVDLMIEQGLENEVRTLYQKYGDKLEKLNIIGYSEMIDYIKGNISLEKAISEIKKNSRHYAKRQFTWFNKKQDYIWLNYNKMSENEMISIILKSLI